MELYYCDEGKNYGPWLTFMECHWSYTSDILGSYLVQADQDFQDCWFVIFQFKTNGYINQCFISNSS